MPTIDRVTSNTVLPKRADVVVIGAGIIGISTALELAERGLSVVVLEKGEVACEQSSRNWGWCRQMGRDAREIPLIREALKLWRGMNERVGAETGFRQCGIMYLSESEKEFAATEKWVRDNAVPHGLETKLIGATEIAQVAPGSTVTWRGGMYTAGDGRAEPFIAVAAMARAFQSLGGQVFTNCAARGIETSAGAVSAVVTERGTINCHQMVLAGGYWSRRFLHNLGIEFPQLGVVNSVMRTTPIDAGFATTISGGKFAARKRLDGGYTVAHNHLSVADIVPDSFRLMRKFSPIFKLDWRSIRLRLGKRFVEEQRLARSWQLDEISPFEKVRILNPKPIHWILDEAEQALKKSFPAFAPFQSAERWAGVIDATPDAVPVISAINQTPGLFLASGFSGHGFGLGPGAGKLMAQIITGETHCVDPTPFLFSRFTDGATPRPTTGL
jgi:glycine/D-amino acid oxidase-like deaminating enzyme